MFGWLFGRKSKTQSGKRETETDSVPEGPEAYKALLETADAYYKQGKMLDAYMIYDEIYDAHPMAKEALRGMIFSALASGDYKNKERHYRDYIRRFGEDEDFTSKYMLKGKLFAKKWFGRMPSVCTDLLNDVCNKVEFSLDRPFNRNMPACYASVVRAHEAGTKMFDAVMNRLLRRKQHGDLPPHVIALVFCVYTGIAAQVLAKSDFECLCGNDLIDVLTSKRGLDEADEFVSEDLLHVKFKSEKGKWLQGLLLYVATIATAHCISENGKASATFEDAATALYYFGVLLCEWLEEEK